MASAASINNLKVSIIIPYRLDGAHRQKIFSWILRRYRLLFPAPQFELCLAEDKNTAFYKTKTVNEAARQATGDIFILADADIFYDPRIIHQSIDLIANRGKQWVMPYTYYRPLTKPYTERYLQSNPGAAIKVSSHPDQLKRQIKYVIKNSPAGLIAITKKAFFELGGYDERFQGWGCEDTAFYSLADCVLHPAVRLNETIYHLWHPRARKKSMTDGTFDKNAALRLEYRRAVKKGKEAALQYIAQVNKSNRSL